MRPTVYIVVSPVRNEAEHLPATIRSMVSQDIRPAEWILVDDGSSDSTALIIADAHRRHKWIRLVHNKDRGIRSPGTGVVEAFYQGYAARSSEDFEFVVKLDGDLEFRPDFFRRCLEYFERDARLGIGGGVILNRMPGGLVPERQPRFHVRGATKIYRRECWDAIGGLFPAPGWDTLDEVKANMKGWGTRSFDDVPVVHLRPTGAAAGAWGNAVKNGRANYIAGYHPLYLFAKVVSRLAKRPLVIGAAGILWGYVTALARREPRIDDRELIRYLRRQQVRALVFAPSIWR